jgi:hypothetical protein
MNDREFTERLLANPQDSSAEFVAALQEAPGREALRADAHSFDLLLRRTLGQVTASAELRQTLLNPAQMEAAKSRREHAAANDSVIRRMLPVAACLVVALGVAFYSRVSQNAALEAEIFDHVYREAMFLDNQQVIAMPDVNTKLDQVLNAQFATGKDAAKMQVTYADDCWVARQITFHMIMRGTNGAVSVMMIPNTPVDSEFSIGDERFDGMVTPTAAGNLVVIGEKQEAIAEYRNLVSDNLKWEY